MESFTLALVSNASEEFSQDNTRSSSTKLLAEQLKVEGQWEVAISENPYPSMWQNVTKVKFLIFDEKFPNSSESFYRQLGFHPSNTDLVEAMNTLIEKRHNHSKNCSTV